MRRLILIAWRNIWRNTRRSLVTIGAMAVAVGAMVMYQSLMEGYLRDMLQSIVEVEMGDLQITREGYRDRPSVFDAVAQSEAVREALEAEGFRATPRLLAGALAASGTSSAGALLQGIDLGVDREVSSLPEEVAVGEWLSVDDPAGVVLGRRLARALGLGLGDEVIVLGQATDGGMANDLFQVRGILGIVSEEIDRSSVFLLAPRFRELFLMPEGAHRILVRRPQELPEAAAKVRATEIMATIGEPLETNSWRDVLPTLGQMLDSVRALIQVVSLVVYVAVGILILNAMLMSVFERINELGVLKAIGMAPRAVLTMILAEGLIQALLGALVGLMLALPCVWYLSIYGLDIGRMAGASVMGMTFSERMYAGFSPLVIIGPVSVLLFVVSLAILWPGLKAARLQPVEAMRYQ